MEVVAATPNGTGVPPYHNHDVREWSRIDSLTGVLERARLETDHWTANTANSSRKYGKVVDCRARSAIDGALHQAKRQLEVFQSHIPGGHLQVIKTHTVSSSRWTKQTTQEDAERTSSNFEDLQLSLNNPLDISSQKAKASVGRSVGRRPPTRQQRNAQQQQKEEPSTTSSFRGSAFRSAQQTAAVNLQRVSRLCHQIHENAVRQAFFGDTSTKPSIHERQNGDGRVDSYDYERDSIEDKKETITNRSLTRAKSTSSDDLSLLTPEKDKAPKSAEDLEDLEQLQNWRRTSKIRRSLQFPNRTKKPTASSRPDDLPENTGSVRRIREDLETGRRLSTALRGNSVDLEALDQILQSISGSSSCSSSHEEVEKEQGKKRNSFVTVESLQEVKGRLRRTSSPSNYMREKEEEPDDGIGADGSSLSLKHLDMPASDFSKSRVRSYVYGMETMLNKKPISGTGSLESKSKLQNGSSVNRNEDWYNRRKSYGFEQVSSQQQNSIQKTKVESSTDSGICRSTELVKNCEGDGVSNVKKFSALFEQKESAPDWKKNELESTKITIPIGTKKSVTNVNGDVFYGEENKRHSIAVDESKYVNNRNLDNKTRRTSLVGNDQYEDNDEDLGNFGRKPKKVGFCKTEVHFAADSGKVNIVETDEKPPPTNNFRRRRKNIGLANLDDFNRNGLPVLHFGDSSYEKSLFGINNPDELSEQTQIGSYETSQMSSGPLGNVTVNTNRYPPELEEDRRETSENEAPRGILKNKPIKPKPYHLGLEDEVLGDVEPPKGSNTWGVQLKHVPREDTPIWRSTVTVRNTFYDKPIDEENGEPEFQKLLKNMKSAPKASEDMDKFGRIQILTPQNDSRRSSWSVADRVKQVEDLQWSENKGYSTKVNFGNGEATVVENGDDFKERHTTWPRRESAKDERQSILNKGLVVRIGRDENTSKHTVCSKTTTDSNTTTTTTKITIDLSPSPLNQEPLFPTRPHDFKSTSLILNTIKQEEKPKPTSIPQQLEALRKLYEDVMSDSEADKEVQSLMSRIGEKDRIEVDDECSSVVSGSWSKIRALRNINRCTTGNGIGASSFSSCAQIEKDLYAEPVPTIPQHDPPNIARARISSTDQVHVRTSSTLASNVDKLSSPSLVGLSRLKAEQPYCDKVEVKEPEPQISKIRTEKGIVLRQPKKSEMAYFGVPVSPRPAKKVAVRKKETKASSEMKLGIKPDVVPQHDVKFKPVKRDGLDSPLYANLEETVDEVRAKREFDASILEELTRAADQILQAVNGYTDDDSHHKHSTDEDKSKNWKPLDTISETKSWHNSSVIQTKTSVARTAHSKSKLKHTSSTSSVESVSRECRRSTPVRKSQSVVAERAKKKVTEAPASTKALTKARRLQRASSREALLQSHGSSSEDLPANVQTPVRKPRLVKKTKVAQLSMSNGLEMNKRSSHTTVNYRNDDARSKADERVSSVSGVPEIRHKTAVSTIRSTAERAASRAKSNNSKVKDDQRRKSSVEKTKETTRVQGSTCSRMERKSATPTNKEAVSHRIATANIKKCSRLETPSKH